MLHHSSVMIGTPSADEKFQELFALYKWEKSIIRAFIKLLDVNENDSRVRGPGSEIIGDAHAWIIDRKCHEEEDYLSHMEACHPSLSQLAAVMSQRFPNISSPEIGPKDENELPTDDPAIDQTNWEQLLGDGNFIVIDSILVRSKYRAKNLDKLILRRLWANLQQLEGKVGKVTVGFTFYHSQPSEEKPNPYSGTGGCLIPEDLLLAAGYRQLYHTDWCYFVPTALQPKSSEPVVPVAPVVPREPPQPSDLESEKAIVNTLLARSIMAQVDKSFAPAGDADIDLTASSWAGRRNKDLPEGNTIVPVPLVEKECTCQRCIDGYISPRMRKALLNAALAIIEFMDNLLLHPDKREPIDEDIWTVIPRGIRCEMMTFDLHIWLRRLVECLYKCLLENLVPTYSNIQLILERKQRPSEVLNALGPLGCFSQTLRMWFGFAKWKGGDNWDEKYKDWHHDYWLELPECRNDRRFDFVEAKFTERRVMDYRQDDPIFFVL
ncbi:hypothetical protein M501DRAFT_989680 [Patellaria atrata CBS 101060]|uniref:Uncharacterized protein n=1 Tax=Patellaria atrata CBS 101060 TaxID=1346257 RepID=A0A9P4VRN0_9PEZI|nr:hypothetical protein M501DRAFT_989680 [Patellaria atrata CBS 101060]